MSGSILRSRLIPTLMAAIVGCAASVPVIASAQTGSSSASAAKRQHENHAGKRGPRGFRGPKGATGSTGESGPAGPQGPTGPGGATGVEGKQGAEGKLGPQGPSTPSEAYEASALEEAEVSTSLWMKLTKKLPPGSYVITGEVQEQNHEEGKVGVLYCELKVGETSLNQMFSDAIGYNKSTYLYGDAANVVQGSYTATASFTLEYICKGTNESESKQVYIRDPSLSAIQVSAIH